MIAGNVDELLVAIDGRSVTTTAGDITLQTQGSPIVETQARLEGSVAVGFTDPNIAFILLLIGIYGILFEFMSPGVVAPGVIGGICLIVALTALSVLPLNYGGLALLLFGHCADGARGLQLPASASSVWVGSSHLSWAHFSSSIRPRRNLGSAWRGH